MTLLLSAQLPVPQGLGKGTIYISTEHPLPTQRLESILKFNPKFRNHTSPPSLDRVFSIHIPDLETQEHILSYQLPVVVQSKDIGLVIIDSITSNYRAEVGMSRSDDGGRSRGKALAARSIDLIKTGALLRNIARKYCCAIVVANQVLDRFEQRNIFLAPECLLRTPLSQGTRNRENKIEKEPVNDSLDLRASETVLARSSPLLLSKNSPSPSPSPIPNWPVSTLSQLPSTALLDPRLTLDYQLRFFTGWGDNENHRQENSKTPALGLAWANQIACRIAIIREGSIINTQSAFSEYDDLDTRKLPESGLGGADWSRRGLRRWMRVVFSAWAPGVVEGDKGVEFEIWEGGLRAVARK